MYINKISDISEQEQSKNRKMVLITELQHSNKNQMRSIQRDTLRKILNSNNESETSNDFQMNNSINVSGSSWCKNSVFHSSLTLLAAEIYKNQSQLNQISENLQTLEQIMSNHEQSIHYLIGQLKQFQADIVMQQTHFDKFTGTLQREASFEMRTVQELFQQMKGPVREMRPLLESTFRKIQYEQLQQCIENSTNSLVQMRTRVEKLEKDVKSVEQGMGKAQKDYAKLKKRMGKM